MIVYVNGAYKPLRKATVSVLDHGFMSGDGVYETLRVYSGRVFKLAEHLDRLAHSAQGVAIRLPLPLKTMGEAVQKTVDLNHHKEAVVRVTLTRGAGEPGFDPALCKKPTFVVYSKPFTPYPRWFHEKGIRAAVVSWRRNSPLSLPPSIKSTSCMNGILAKIESLDAEAQEAVFLNLQDEVAEGSVSNVFRVKNGRLETPPLDGHKLAGVTRGHLLGLAARARIPVQERVLKLSEFLDSDEIVLTNTTLEVVPVRELIVKGRVHWRGKTGQAGSVTSHLRFLFDRSVRLFRLKGAG